MTSSKTARPRWRQEDETYLRWAYGTGVPVERIAERLGRTAATVRKKASRLGLRRPGLTGREGSQDDIATRLRVLLGEEVRGRNAQASLSTMRPISW